MPFDPYGLPSGPGAPRPIGWTNPLAAEQAQERVSPLAGYLQLAEGVPVVGPLFKATQYAGGTLAGIPEPGAPVARGPERPMSWGTPSAMPIPASTPELVAMGSSGGGTSRTRGIPLNPAVEMGLERASVARRKAILAEGQIAAQAAANQAAAYQEMLREKASTKAAFRAKQVTLEAAIAEREKLITSIEDDIREREPDPNRYWAQKNPAQKIAAFIAAALAGAAQGMRGQTGKNPVVAMIDAEIERDIALQERALGRRRSDLQEQRGILGQLQGKLEGLPQQEAVAYRMLAADAQDLMQGVALQAKSPLLKAAAVKAAADWETHYLEKFGQRWAAAQDKITMTSHGTRTQYGIKMVSPGGQIVAPVPLAKAVAAAAAGWQPAAKQDARAMEAQKEASWKSFSKEERDELRKKQSMWMEVQELKKRFDELRMHGKGIISPTAISSWRSEFGRFIDKYRKDITGAQAAEKELATIESRFRVGLIPAAAIPALFYNRMNSFLSEIRRDVEGFDPEGRQRAFLKPEIAEQMEAHRGTAWATQQDLKRIGR